MNIPLFVIVVMFGATVVHCCAPRQTTTSLDTCGGTNTDQTFFSDAAMELNAVPNRQLKATLRCPAAGVTNKKITCYVITDLLKSLGQGASDIKITSGGVGSNSMVVEITSQTGKGYAVSLSCRGVGM